MANPTLALTFAQNIDGVTGVVTDTTTNYGGANPARATLGNYLLWSKTDSEGTQAFTNPTQTLPHSISTWTVDTTEDGWHQAILLSVADFSAGGTYVKEVTDSQGIVTTYADIVYYDTTKKWYKCITDISGSVPAPDSGSGPTYWQEVTDMSALIANTKVNKVVLDVAITVLTDKCVKDAFYQKISACGCKPSFKEMEKPLQGYFLAIGAMSKFNDSKPSEFEEIVSELSEMCGLC